MGEIKFDKRNYRLHNDENKRVIKKSLKELGAGRSIVIDNEGEIIAGNGVYEQAQKLGIKTKIVETDGSELVVVKRTDLATGDDKRKKLALADNASSDTSKWADDLLREDWTPDVLADWGVELPEIEEAPTEEAQEDDFDEEKEPIEKKVSAGEIWQLGAHRLMCGDSTIAKNFEMLLDGEKADLCFTSPPYNNAGHAITTGNFTKGSVSQKLYGEQGYSDDRESSDYIKLCRDVLDNMFKFTDGYIFWNVNYNANARTEYIQQIIDKLDYLSDLICWKKRMAITNTRGGLTRIWEPIFVFSTDKTPLKVNCILNNHWEVDNVNASYENHRACFPVALPAKAIQSIAKEINIILEPFGGTGSTLIACEQLGRKCYMMELDPHYCDVIIARWEKLTGQKAIKL